MNRRGSVLIIVLWVSLGLVALVLTFSHSMMMAYRGADNDLAGRQAEQALEGAERYALGVLAAGTAGEMPDITTYESEAVPLGDATFWFIGDPDVYQPGNTSVTTTSTSGTDIPAWGLVDESAKLNLNTATPDMLAQLVAVVPDMTQDFAEAIKDWHDDDDDVTGNGAESETYQQRRPPYNAKNAPFESIEELGLVNGATTSILYGADLNLNGVLDAGENDTATTPRTTTTGTTGSSYSGLLRYVTCFSRMSNKQPDGTTQRVSILKPSADLTNLLGLRLDANQAATILGALGPNWTATSVLDFFVKSQMTDDQFAQLADYLTAKPNALYVEGLVNVNTASEVVLSCIPGIGTQYASTIVAQRAKSQTSTGLGWLKAIIGPAGCEQAGPYVTGQTYCVCADVAAVGRNGRGYRRARFILDLSSGTPRVIYRRSLSALGWALGAQARQDLALRKGGT